jgi:hypothetical protein
MSVIVLFAVNDFHGKISVGRRADLCQPSGEIFASDQPLGPIANSLEDSACRGAVELVLNILGAIGKHTSRGHDRATHTGPK